MKLSKIKILIIIITLVVLGFILFLFKNKNTTENFSAYIQSGVVSRSLEVDATVVNGAEYDLTFIEEGQIDSVFVWVGKKVKKGDILITLYNSDERKNYNNALSILKKAEERYRKILNTEVKDNPKEKKDHEDALDLALSDVVAAQVLVESTRAIVERTRVRAPIDGVITKVLGRVDQVVGTDISVISISDKDNYYLESDVSIYDGIFVSRGQRVSIGSRNNAIQSSVTGLKNVGERLLISTLLPNKDFEVGSIVQTRIITAEVRDVLFVNRNSLYETENGYYLQVQNTEDGKLNNVFVSVGLTGDNDFVEIKSGVSEGDLIIWEKEGL